MPKRNLNGRSRERISVDQPRAEPLNASPLMRIQKPTNESQLLGRHNMAMDPVCNMEVDELDTKFNSQYGNQTYYFCSEECKDTFDNKPEQFAASAA
jgi:YHS domain-containing protein